MLRNLMKEKGFLGNTKSFSNLSKMNAAAPKNFNGITRALFAASEQGLSYDFNDLSTLFQDSAGTIPVTGAGQPVGLVLDKSRGLVLGPELWVSPTLGAEWIDNGGGSYTFNSPTGAYAELAIAGLSAGKFYEVRFTASVVQNQVSVRQNGVIKSAQYNSGTFRLFVTGGTNVTFSRYNGGGVASLFTVSSISVRELPGNHAFQSTAASRPILRQSPILGPELVSNGAFDTGTGWTLSAGVSLATEGVQLDAQYEYVEQSIGVVQQRKYIVSYDVLSASGVNPLALSSGGFTNTTTPIPTSTTKRNSVEVTCEDSAKPLRFIAPYTGTTVVIDNISVREIQGYYTDRNYLEYDGVDDFLQTNSVDFTGTDKVAVFAGVRKLSDAAVGTICELSNSYANADTFGLRVGDPSTNVGWHMNGGTTWNNLNTVGLQAAPLSLVITAKGNFGASDAEGVSSLSVNGSTPILAGTTSIGTGNFGNYPLYIGRRGGTSLPFNGHLYGLTIIGRLTNDLETRNIEKLLAKNTGVSLV